MRKLNEILDGILDGISCDYNSRGDLDVSIKDIHLDSRSINTGDAFVALKGASLDGHQYISSAIEQGATVVFCEYLPEGLSTKVTYVITPGLKTILPELAALVYGSPDKKLTLIGVTGTNGKTTVATMFFNLLRKLNISCGMISTVKICLNEDTIPSKLTTPDVLTVYRYLNMMVKEGFEYAIMEVSSHAIHQNRIAGLNYKIAVFTNISHDHLDYHKTFKEYLNTKKKFFDDLDPKSIAITNIDDRNGDVMIQNTAAKVKTYAMRSMADYKAKILEHDFSGMHIQMGMHDFYTTLVGEFNVYNLLAVIAIADQLDFDMMEVLTILSNVKTAPGRFDLLRNDVLDISGIVDYAHTPDALDNVLKTIYKVNRNRGKILTIVGCGGDRDKRKRPLMAKVAIQYSDKVILTSDNPRTENPEAILDDMEMGVTPADKKKVLRISERKAAIQTAVNLAQQFDVILVAGKGHENYQEIMGVRYPFDDKQILQEFLLE